MRINTPLLEISGITVVWINNISRWERITNEFGKTFWLKTNGGDGFNGITTPENILRITKSPEDFHKMLDKLFDKRFPYEDCEGYSPRMYRAWVSGSTLNVVQRKMTKNKDGTYNVE